MPLGHKWKGAQHRQDSIHQLEQKSQSSLAHQEASAAESQNGFLRRGTAWLQTRDVHNPAPARLPHRQQKTTDQSHSS